MTIIEESLKEQFEILQNRFKGTFVEFLNLSFHIVKKDHIQARFEALSSMCQPFGYLHGGASVSIAETLGSIGAHLNLDDPKNLAVCIEINANHVKAVRVGSCVSVDARPLHRGKTSHVWEVRCNEEENGTLVMISRMTIRLISH